MATEHTISVKVESKSAESGAKKAKDAINSVGDSAKASEKSVSSFSGAIKAMIAGFAAATSISAVTKEVLEFQKAEIRLASQLGITTKEAKEFNKAAQDIYKSGIGGSIQEIGDQVAYTAQSFKQLGVTAPRDIAEITKASSRLADLYGTDVSQNTEAAQVLMKEFGLNAQESFDLLASGYQRGLNTADDFLDSVREYSNQFAQGGASADQFFSVMETGLAGGVLGTDKAADMFKEFQIRIKDGSKLTSESLQMIGLSADDIAEKIKTKQMTVAEAFHLVQGRIAEVGDTSIQMQAGVGVFGTQLEDLTIGTAMGINMAATSMDDMKGSLDAVNQAAGQDASRIFTSAWRTFTTEIATNPALQQMALDLANMAMSLAEATPQVIAFVQNNADLIGYAAGIYGLSKAFLAIPSAITTVSGAYTGLIASVGGTYASMQNSIKSLRDLSIAGFKAMSAGATTFFNVMKAGYLASVSYGGSFLSSLKAVTAQLATTAGSAQFAAGWMGKLKVAGLVSFAALAGYGIGTMLRDQFVEVRVAGIAMVEGVMTGFEWLKSSAQTVYSFLYSGFQSLFGSIQSLAYEGIAAISKGWIFIKSSFDAVANGIAASWNSLVSSITSYLSDIVGKGAQAAFVLGADDQAGKLYELQESLRKTSVSYKNMAKTITTDSVGAYDQQIAAINAELAAKKASIPVSANFNEALDEINANYAANVASIKSITGEMADYEVAQESAKSTQTQVTEAIQEASKAELDNIKALKKSGDEKASLSDITTDLTRETGQGTKSIEELGGSLADSGSKTKEAAAKMFDYERMVESAREAVQRFIDDLVVQQETVGFTEQEKALYNFRQELVKTNDYTADEIELEIQKAAAIQDSVAQKEAQIEANKKSGDVLVSLQEELKLINMTSDAERERYNALKDVVEQDKEQASALYDQIQQRKELDKLGDLEEQLKLSQMSTDAERERYQTLKDFAPEYQDQASAMLDQIEQQEQSNAMWDEMSSKAGEFFDDILSGNKSAGESFKDFAGGMVQSWNSALASMAQQQITDLFSGGGGGGGIIDSIGSLFGGGGDSASGGILDSVGSLFSGEGGLLDGVAGLFEGGGLGDAISGVTDSLSGITEGFGGLGVVTGGLSAGMSLLSGDMAGAATGVGQLLGSLTPLGPLGGMLGGMIGGSLFGTWEEEARGIRADIKFSMGELNSDFSLWIKEVNKGIIGGGSRVRTEALDEGTIAELKGPFGETIKLINQMGNDLQTNLLPNLEGFSAFIGVTHEDTITYEEFVAQSTADMIKNAVGGLKVTGIDTDLSTMMAAKVNNVIGDITSGTFNEAVQAEFWSGKYSVEKANEIGAALSSGINEFVANTDFTGLTPEEINAALSEQFGAMFSELGVNIPQSAIEEIGASIGVQLASAVDFLETGTGGITEDAAFFVALRDMTLQLDGTGEEVAQFVSQMMVLRDTFQLAGFSTSEISKELITMGGGVTQFNNSLSAFYDGFLTEEEQRINSLNVLNKGLTASFSELGMAIPASRDEFKALVQGLGDDLSTFEAQAEFTSLIGLSADLDEYYSLLEQGTNQTIVAIDSFSNAFSNLSDIISQSDISNALTSSITDAGNAQEAGQLFANQMAQSLVDGIQGTVIGTVSQIVMDSIVQPLMQSAISESQTKIQAANMAAQTDVQASNMAAQSGVQASAQSGANLIQGGASAASALGAGAESARSLIDNAIAEVKNFLEISQAVFADESIQQMFSEMMPAFEEIGSATFTAVQPLQQYTAAATTATNATSSMSSSTSKSADAASDAAKAEDDLAEKRLESLADFRQTMDELSTGLDGSALSLYQITKAIGDADLSLIDFGQSSTEIAAQFRDLTDEQIIALAEETGLAINELEGYVSDYIEIRADEEKANAEYLLSVAQFQGSLKTYYDGLSDSERAIEGLGEKYGVFTSAVELSGIKASDAAEYIANLSGDELLEIAQAYGITTEQLMSDATLLVESISDLNEAEAKAKEFTDGLRKELETFALSGQQLELFELDEWRDDLVSQADELGADIYEIEELYALRRKDIITKYAVEAANELTSTYTGLMDKFSGLSTSVQSDIANIRGVSATEQKTTAREEFANLGAIESVADMEDRIDRANEYRQLVLDSIGEQIDAVKEQRDKAYDNYQIDLKAYEDEKSRIEDLKQSYKDQADDVKEQITDLTNQFAEDIQSLKDDWAASIKETEADFAARIREAQGLEEETVENTLQAKLDAIEEEKSAALDAYNEQISALEALKDSAGELSSTIKDDIQTLLKEMSGGSDTSSQMSAARATLASGSPEERLGAAQNLRDLTLESLDEQIAKVEERRQKESEAYDEYLEYQSSLVDYAKDLRGFVDDLMLGENSPLTNQERLIEAERQYQSLLAQAQAGNADAIAELQGAASVYLDEAKSFYASSEQYGDIFKTVTGDVKTLAGGLEAEASAAASGEQASFDDTAFANEISALQQNAVEQLTGLNDEIISLQDELSNQIESASFDASEWEQQAADARQEAVNELVLLRDATIAQMGLDRDAAIAQMQSDRDAQVLELQESRNVLLRQAAQQDLMLAQLSKPTFDESQFEDMIESINNAGIAELEEIQTAIDAGEAYTTQVYVDQMTALGQSIGLGHDEIVTAIGSLSGALGSYAASVNAQAKASAEPVYQGGVSYDAVSTGGYSDKEIKQAIDMVSADANLSDQEKITTIAKAAKENNISATRLANVIGISKEDVINAAQSAGVAFADGGVVDEPTVGLFGEAGREAVVPLDNNGGIPNLNTDRMEQLLERVVTELVEQKQRLDSIQYNQKVQTDKITDQQAKSSAEQVRASRDAARRNKAKVGIT